MELHRKMPLLRKIDVPISDVDIEYSRKYHVPEIQSIEYGEDYRPNTNKLAKYSWQVEAYKSIRRSLHKSQGLISISAKTGHGKTKVMCRSAFRDLRRGEKVVIYIKAWIETYQQFHKEILSQDKFTIKTNSDQDTAYQYTHPEWAGEIHIVKFPQAHKQIKGILDKYESFHTHIFDEAHIVMPYLGIRHFASHNCWNAKRIKSFHELWKVHECSPLMKMCIRSKVILFSATFDADIVQELSVYSGLFPIKTIVCKPHRNVIEDICAKWEQSETKDIIMNTVKVVLRECDMLGSQGRMMIYMATTTLVEKLIQTLKHLEIEDIYSCTSTDSNLLDKDKFKKINVFCEQATAGIDDPSIKVVIIGREMSDTNTNRGLKFKRIVSSLAEQMIGRIRGEGRVYFVCNKMVTVNSLKDNIIARIDHIIEEAPMTYALMYSHNIRRIRNISESTFINHLEKFCIPALLNTFIRDNHSRFTVCDGAFEDLNEYGSYRILSMNKANRDSPEDMSKHYDSVCRKMMDLYQVYYDTQSQIPIADSRNPGADSRNPGADSRNPGADSRNPGADSRNPGADSRNPGADYRPNPRMKTVHGSLDGRNTTLSKTNPKRKQSFQGRHDPPKKSHTERDQDVCDEKTRRIVDERSGGKCEMCKTSWGTLQNARIHEGKEDGIYTPDNIIKMCPNCHSVFDLNEIEMYMKVGYDVREGYVNFYLIINENDEESINKVKHWNVNVRNLIQGERGILLNFKKRKRCDTIRHQKEACQEE